NTLLSSTWTRYFKMETVLTPSFGRKGRSASHLDDPIALLVGPIDVFLFLFEKLQQHSPLIITTSSPAQNMR
ncbi:MAG: hypothetical protein ACWGMZ_04300, partial [Thermoguttaceae bacterium]